MKCQAERCDHEQMFVVEGPGKAMKLCGCCAEKAYDVALAAGVRVDVTDLRGTKPCAMPAGRLDLETLSDVDLVRLHDAVHDAMELRAASKKRGIA